MNIEKQHLKIVLDILNKYPYTFYAFGSRTTEKARKLSDLDLCFFDTIPSSTLLKIEEDFEESDLPYKVDLVDWNKCSSEFQKIISQNMIRLDNNQ